MSVSINRKKRKKEKGGTKAGRNVARGRLACSSSHTFNLRWMATHNVLQTRNAFKGYMFGQISSALGFFLRAPHIRPFFFSFLFFSSSFFFLLPAQTMHQVEISVVRVACEKAKTREVLTRHRVTTNQKHVTFVTNAHRLRWVRQGCGIVAAGVAENVPAIATMVLQQKQHPQEVYY